MSKGQYVFVSNLLILLLYAFSYCSVRIYAEDSMSFYYRSYYLKPEHDINFEHPGECKEIKKPNKKDIITNFNYKYNSKNKHSGYIRKKLNSKSYNMRRGVIH